MNGYKIMERYEKQFEEVKKYIFKKANSYKGDKTYYVFDKSLDKLNAIANIMYNEFSRKKWQVEFTGIQDKNISNDLKNELNNYHFSKLSDIRDIFNNYSE